MNGHEDHPRFLPGLGRLAVVVIGIVLFQFVLYGPSLVGKKVLLPVDNLALPSVYLPKAVAANIHPDDPMRLDPIWQFEPDRRFAVNEMKAGRFPMWTPYEYGGAPFIWPKYSPFLLFTCLTPSPVILAWAQLLAALVAGVGMYLFCRRVLETGFWPATLAAWCYPLTGFFVFWEGFPTCLAVYWLPWLLMTVDGTIRGRVGAPVALALMTGLTLVSGHMDVAGQVLLISGLFALWRLVEMQGSHLWRLPAAKTIGRLTCAWGIGFMLAMPYLLPILEYAKSGERMTHRAAGAEERPPLGIRTLPQAVLPDMYGSSQYGSSGLIADEESNLMESPSAAYAGILATLLAAPLAWFSGRHRRMNIFWVLLAVFGLAWCVDLPGVVQLLRLPGLNMMSHNRLVFATGFAITAMAAVGIEALRLGQVRWHRGLWIPAGLLAGFCLWCLYRAEFLPDSLATRLAAYIQSGHTFYWIKTLEDVRRAQNWFSWHYTVPAIWCAGGLIGCLMLRRGKGPRLAPVLGVLLIADLLWFSHGRNVQCDPSFYYPAIPALQDAAGATSDRVIGFDCLPPKLSSMAGLRDVRGYDPVDPGRWLALLTNAADARSPIASYAKSLWLMPQLLPTNSTQYVRLPPVLNLLSVRYVIFRGPAPAGTRPKFESDDYHLLENPAALPRVFVPARAEGAANERDELAKILAPDFDPAKTAYVETAETLPSNSRGSAAIERETPMDVLVRARMDTAGVVVLADSWNRGWKATVNGKPAPILRTDYVLRGVVLPPGESVIEFRYDSDTVRRASRIAVLAMVILLGWLLVEGRSGFRRHPAAL